MFENQNNNNVQFENQQLGNGFYGDSGVETITPKKKGKKIAVISGITAAALAGGCATAYAVSDTVKNQVKLRTMKPEKYYAWVYEHNTSEISKNISSRYSQQLDRYKDGIGVNYSINYEMPDSVKSQLKEAAGDEELNSIIDNIKKISLDMSGSMKDGTAGYNIGASLNGDKLASIDYDIDLDTFDIFVRCPELTEKWAAIDMGDQIAYNEDAEKMLDFYKEFLSDPESVLSASDLETEINKYVSIWSDNTKDVKIEKKETLNIGDITVDYTVAEVKVTPEMAKDMAEKYSEAVKNDEIIRNIWVNKLGMDESELTSQLDDVISELNASESEGDVTFKTYIDPTGTIRGISIINSDGEEAKAIIGKEDTKIRGEFSIVNECKATLTADETADKTYSGTLDVDADGETVKIDFDGLKVVNETNGYTEGTVKITAEESDVIVLNLSSDGKSQDIDYDINIDGTNYGKLNINIAETKGEAASLPSKSDAFVISQDNMQDLKLEDYVAQSEVESFLNDIFTKVGIKDAGEASKSIADSIYNGGLAGSTNYESYDDSDYEWDEEDYDWDDADFDWEGEDYDWDDYDFSEEDFSIEIPDTTMPEIKIS